MTTDDKNTMGRMTPRSPIGPLFCLVEVKDTRSVDHGNTTADTRRELVFQSIAPKQTAPGRTLLTLEGGFELRFHESTDDLHRSSGFELGACYRLVKVPAP